MPPQIPNFKIVFPKGKFNGIRAHYIAYYARTQTSVWGMRVFVLLSVGCASCKEQQGRPWVPCVNSSMEQHYHYARNKECTLWPSYEGMNDWKISQLVPVTVENEKRVWDLIQCVFNALEAQMFLMICEGKVSAVGTTDKVAMGCCLVRWLSKPYMLQVDTEGMSCVIGTGAMVVEGVYYNRVKQEGLITSTIVLN